MNDNKWRIGKNYTQLYGTEKAMQIIKKQSKRAFIRFSDKTNHPFFGKTRSVETKEKCRLKKLGNLNPAKRQDVRDKMSLHAYGKKLKGRSYIEIYGVDKAKEIKQKQSIRHRGIRPTFEMRLAKRARMIMHPIKKFSNTLIEQKTTIELERRGFIRNEDFFQNFGIARIKNVDFYLPKLNVVIECDGCFYHACHQCGFIKYHQDMIKSDINNTILLETAGYTLYRFWGHDIVDSIDNCINKII